MVVANGLSKVTALLGFEIQLNGLSECVCCIYATINPPFCADFMSRISTRNTLFSTKGWWKN